PVRRPEFHSPGHIVESPTNPLGPCLLYVADFAQALYIPFPPPAIGFLLPPLGFLSMGDPEHFHSNTLLSLAGFNV
ncbi:hypothetical protein GDO86_019004, partial [Hymenochirus boettgeri]